jgi:hypothetical protein
VASNYTGNQGATQAPSGPPTPDGNPVALLPATGDPRNAASVAQMVKVGMDWIAWLMKPRPIASQWAQAIMRYRSAAGHQRFGVDHLGFPMGRIQSWRENWFSSLEIAGGNPSVATAISDGGWRFGGLRTAGGSSGVGTTVPLSTGPGGRTLSIEVSDNGGDYSYAQRSEAARFQTDLSLAMEWDVTLTSLANYGIGMGFNFISTFLAGGHGPIAQFYNLAGSGNWRCHTDDGTTLDDQDSGVAVSTNRTRFRIEYHGASVDDAGTERVLFFINGVLRQNMTARMPSGDASPYARPFLGMVNTGGSGGHINVGPMSFGANLDVDAF